jgi:hypothetical protein
MTAPNKPEQSQVVPEGAVEAVAKQLSLGRCVSIEFTWDRLPESERDEYRDLAKAVLAAALPHLLAANPAQAAGAQVGVPDFLEVDLLALTRNDSTVEEIEARMSIRQQFAALRAAAPKPAAEGVKPDEAVVRDAEIPLLRQVAKRNLGRLIELGSDDKALMLSCLDELS